MSLSNIIAVHLKNRCLYVLATQPSSQLLIPQNGPICQQQRTFLPQLPNPFSRGNKSGTGKRLEYSERRILGYSMEQMYSIVADVSNYTEFVPFCTKANVFSQRPGHFKCGMSVGFGPITESYTSVVTVVKPHLVRAECSDGQLFSYLLNNWQFSPGLPGNVRTCTLDFGVAFEFRNAAYAHLSKTVFDVLVKTMVNAFLKRGKELYGPQTIGYSQRKKEILVYNDSGS